MRIGAALLLSLGLTAASPSLAQVRFLPDEVQRVDVIAIERDGRNVFAFNSLTGGRAEIQLEVGEDVLFEGVRGRVGLLLTDRRALGVAPGVSWQELRYGLTESSPDVAVLDDQIGVVVTDRRALGFVARGTWVEQRFDTHEAPVALRVGAAVGVVLTDRRALGVAPNLSRFIETELQIKEVVESVAAQGTLATLRTNRRILVFSAPRAFWSEQERNLK